MSDADPAGEFGSDLESKGDSEGEGERERKPATLTCVGQTNRRWVSLLSSSSSSSQSCPLSHTYLAQDSQGEAMRELPYTFTSNVCMFY